MMSKTKACSDNRHKAGLMPSDIIILAWLASRQTSHDRAHNGLHSGVRVVWLHYTAQLPVRTLANPNFR